MDGRLQEARDAAQALQEKFPNTALVNLIAALPLVAQKKETKKALLLLEKALSAKESSTLAQVHFARGVLFARTERFAKAAEAFEAVTRLRMDAIAHANAAIAHAAMGQTERALQQLARAGDLDPKAPQIACLQALVLWKQGKRERAHKELARAKALKPPLADVFELEAQLAIDEKNWEVAAAALKEAIALDNGNANAHFNLGLTLLEIGKLRAARNEFAIAAKLNPKDADAKHNYDALTRVLARP
jgi:tetratricopeptide (TPR) repeat protein